MTSTRFDPADPDYFYPHADGTVPEGAATITDAEGLVWQLATARAVPTGLYLWGRRWSEDGRWVFRTLSQLTSHRGLTRDAVDAARHAEVAQFDRHYAAHPAAPAS